MHVRARDVSLATPCEQDSQLGPVLDGDKAVVRRQVPSPEEMTLCPVIIHSAKDVDAVAMRAHCAASAMDLCTGESLSTLVVQKVSPWAPGPCLGIDRVTVPPCRFLQDFEGYTGKEFLRWSRSASETQANSK